MERENMLPDIPSGSFVQFSADNVDHNTRTLDGKNTFHGMGIIACVTPSVNTPSIQVRRSSTRQPLPDISTVKGIPIMGYFGKAVPSKCLMFDSYDLLTEKIKSEEETYGQFLDIVWFSNWKTDGKRKSSWMGFMQTSYHLTN